MDILPGLTTQQLGRRLIRLAQVDSTNDYLKEHAHTLPDLSVVMADRQTRGKGRSGRDWHSQPGDGLYMSVLLKDACAGALSRMPLLVALAVRAGLGNLCGLPFEIKWSNDLLFDGKKLCGILCENRPIAGQNTVAIGIGVNLTQSREALDHLGLVYATSLLLATNKLFSPKQTAGAICNALEGVLLQSSGDISPLWEQYRKHCVTLGRQVKIIRGDEQTDAKAVDIAEDGSLICEIDGRLVPICAGEVRIRGMDGYV